MLKPRVIKVKVEGPSDIGSFYATSNDLKGLLAHANTYGEALINADKAIKDLHLAMGFVVELTHIPSSDDGDLILINPVEDRRLDRIKEEIGVNISYDQTTNRIRYDLESVIYEGKAEINNCKLDSVAINTLERIATHLAVIERILKDPNAVDEEVKI